MELKLCFGWIIGYFLLLFPFFYTSCGKLTDGLIIGIIGLVVAIFLLKGWLFTSD